jgi:uncharacterized protein YbjT (DUF2867 family)
MKVGATVRALTRNPESAALPQQVETVRGDLTLPQTLDGPLDGVDTVFLLWRAAGSPSAPVFERIANSVRRIVFLSSSLVRDDLARQTNPIAYAHADIEAIIRQSGVEWTFLRPGAFATNALSSWAPQIRSGNLVRWPYGAAAFPPIHERDIAAVAVRTLLEPGHGGKKYFLTGPESLTQAEQVKGIGDAIGRPLRFEELTPDVARQELSAVLPSLVIEILLEAWPSMVTHPVPALRTVEEITGSPARGFREWAKDHAADFAEIIARPPGVHSDLREAISMEKRYFTSDLSSLS